MDFSFKLLTASNESITVIFAFLHLCITLFKCTCAKETTEVKSNEKCEQGMRQCKKFIVKFYLVSRALKIHHVVKDPAVHGTADFVASDKVDYLLQLTIRVLTSIGR